MTLVPLSHRPDADLLPPLLRSLLEAELAAGNGILEVAFATAARARHGRDPGGG